MKIKHVLIGALLIPISLLFFSCDVFSTMDVNDTNVVSDAQDMQALIPGAEAALAVFKNSSTVKTFWAGVSASNIDTSKVGSPATVYTDYLVSGKDYARFPESGYMEDYYGTKGNDAYFELRKVTDGWGDYQITLYIYPVLSTSVYYIKEQYRVMADSWDMVNRDGVKDPVAYETNETHYYDGRVETRDVLWTRYVDDQILPASDFGFVDDPNNISITTDFTKNDIPDFAKTAASAGDGQYSSITESTIPATPESGFISTWAKEFYSELSDGYHYSQSYVFNDLNALARNTTTKTIRVYKENASTGDKWIRSKSVSQFSWFNNTWTTTTTEKIDITNTADGVQYNSTVVKKVNDATNIKTLVELKETGQDTNTYKGTQTIEYYDSNGRLISKLTYTISLDREKGLQITDSNGNPILSLSASNQNLLPIIKIYLRHGSFSGRLIGRGVLKGIYTSGYRRAAVTIGRSFIKIVSGRNELLK